MHRFVIVLSLLLLVGCASAKPLEEEPQAPLVATSSSALDSIESHYMKRQEQVDKLIERIIDAPTSAEAERWTQVLANIALVDSALIENIVSRATALNNVRNSVANGPDSRFDAQKFATQFAQARERIKPARGERQGETSIEPATR